MRMLRALSLIRALLWRVFPNNLCNGAELQVLLLHSSSNSSRHAGNSVGNARCDPIPRQCEAWPRAHTGSNVARSSPVCWDQSYAPRRYSASCNSRSTFSTLSCTSGDANTKCGRRSHSNAASRLYCVIANSAIFRPTALICATLLRAPLLRVCRAIRKLRVRVIVYCSILRAAPN